MNQIIKKIDEIIRGFNQNKDIAKLIKKYLKRTVIIDDDVVNDLTLKVECIKELKKNYPNKKINGVLEELLRKNNFNCDLQSFLDALDIEISKLESTYCNGLLLKSRDVYALFPLLDALNLTNSFLEPDKYLLLEKDNILLKMEEKDNFLQLISEDNLWLLLSQYLNGEDYHKTIGLMKHKFKNETAFLVAYCEALKLYSHILINNDKYYNLINNLVYSQELSLDDCHEIKALMKQLLMHKNKIIDFKKIINQAYRTYENNLFEICILKKLRQELKKNISLSIMFKEMDNGTYLTYLKRKYTNEDILFIQSNVHNYSDVIPYCCQWELAALMYYLNHDNQQVINYLANIYDNLLLRKAYQTEKKSDLAAFAYSNLLKDEMDILTYQTIFRGETPLLNKIKNIFGVLYDSETVDYLNNTHNDYQEADFSKYVFETLRALRKDTLLDFFEQINFIKEFLNQNDDIVLTDNLFLSTFIDGLLTCESNIYFEENIKNVNYYAGLFLALVMVNKEVGLKYQNKALQIMPSDLFNILVSSHNINEVISKLFNHKEMQDITKDIIDIYPDLEDIVKVGYRNRYKVFIETYNDVKYAIDENYYQQMMELKSEKAKAKQEKEEQDVQNIQIKNLQKEISLAKKELDRMKIKADTLTRKVVNAKDDDVMIEKAYQAIEDAKMMEEKIHYLQNEKDKLQNHQEVEKEIDEPVLKLKEEALFVQETQKEEKQEEKGQDTSIKPLEEASVKPIVKTTTSKKRGIYYFAIIVLLIGILVFVLNLNNSKTVLTLLGNQEMVITQYTKYIEPGFTAFDSEGNDITQSVIIEGAVDTSQIGEYTITYSVMDLRNHLVQVKRKVIVDASDKMFSLNLLGSSEITLEKNSEYHEEGFVAIDSNGDNITYKVNVNNNCNTSIVGECRVIYTVTNSYGHVLQKERKVVVVDK